MRDGNNCPLCGTPVYNWQEDEFDVIGLLCPECSLEADDYANGDVEFLDYLEVALW